MKSFNLVDADIVTYNDLKQIVSNIQQTYPTTISTNLYKEQIDQSLLYLNYLPQQLFGFTNPIDVIILNIFNTHDSETIGWHDDSPLGNQVTVLFYPQISPDCGGEFRTQKNTHTIQPGDVIVLPSNEIHKINPYVNYDVARISIKWMFNIPEQQVEQFRD